ncbi:class I SAM-dependent methyltransferase [Candidatus Manganitrophus noduliformans]|nr:class I SAM-dependent methyltransferase [Candidatus Manganitrophus noduliformans]
MDAEDRYKHEREYWDRRAEVILRDPAYSYRHPHLPTLEDLGRSIPYLVPVIDFWGPVRGKRVLDLACGDGWISLSLAKSGAMAYGCDISPNLIEIAMRYASENNLSDLTDFRTMASEEITYQDEFFDFVIMHAALHHCDLDKTTNQVRRVLKPRGKAVFIEDYAYHPLMRLYRRMTPGQHTETEEALDDENLAQIVSRFSSHHFEHYGIFNLFETSASRFATKFRPVLRKIDSVLMKGFPRIRRYAKLVQIFVVK